MKRSAFLITFVFINFSASAQIESTSLPTGTPPPAGGFLKFKASAAQKEATYRMLDAQEKSQIAANNKAGTDPVASRGRAEQMVQMLQNEELTKAFNRITENSDKMMKENQEVTAPLAVIAEAAGLWYGRTVKLIRGDDFNFNARMEARNKRGEFSMNSPLLNGRFRYDQLNGNDVGVNRSIGSIKTQAGFQYNMSTQIFSTEVRKAISPNLDLSFGSSRVDQTTKIEYRLNF